MARPGEGASWFSATFQTSGAIKSSDFSTAYESLSFTYIVTESRHSARAAGLNALTAMRITAGMERAASEGRWVVGTTPFGLRGALI
ncbi:MAG: hypothetical protein ACREA0_02745 [bacterium]